MEWLTLNDASGATTEENNATVRARFVAVWTQIAERFAHHGEELLFESMNEIHDGYGTPDPRHIAFINQLNQTFVRLVRASGGNNAERRLVLPGYNTNIEHTVSGFELPADSTPNRLILSVHFYDPYLYALQAKTHTWGWSTSPRRRWTGAFCPSTGTTVASASQTYEVTWGRLAAREADVPFGSDIDRAARPLSL